MLRDQEPDFHLPDSYKAHIRHFFSFVDETQLEQTSSVRGKLHGWNKCVNIKKFGHDFTGGLTAPPIYTGWYCNMSFKSYTV